MAVVVQQMIRPRAAGVLFTANPLTGTRSEMIIDAIAGLGDVVVDGSADSDHYVLTTDRPIERPPTGCLTQTDLDQLQQAGHRLQQQFGSPQDIEWAIDSDDQLWLLQSRPITTLYPLPPNADPCDPRVYLEVGHMQGLLRPITPMGLSALMTVTRQWFEAFGIAETGQQLITMIGGRMYLDLTMIIRSPRMRRQSVEAMDIYGPSVKTGLQKLLADPRFAPERHKSEFGFGFVVKIAATMMPSTVTGMARSMIAPARTRRRAFRIRDSVRDTPLPAAELGTTERIARAASAQDPVIGGAMMRLLPPLWTEMTARGVAEGLLTGIAEPGEIDSIGRGMPYNVTTEMDLRLWQVAVTARPHRELLINTDPDELARRYLEGELPDFGLTAFLADYGQRAAAEIDLGVPRWEEDPTPVFAALAGYLRLTDPEQAPDVRFRRAAAEAEDALDRLVGRASRRRPLRAALAGFLLRRWRSLAGLRELPKFVWLYPLRDARKELLLAGDEIARSGRLEEAEDIMFLTLEEATQAAEGTDQRQLVEQRRAEHQRNERFVRVPGLVLSDGTLPEALPDDTAPEEETSNQLVGVPAAAGRVTGTVRVVHDPATARLEPGDILVATTTDPGWTPLFMTIGGLVTEKGSPIAHGPTVAREYGIPAVICVRDATTRLTTGQRVTVDGASGTVTIDDS